ncbi:hypothetical protein [Phaeobacter piscinae]|uniref:hypothetical protein n=1 Tax=Phaeobacter piscinae TaxID=1580596 RepID=UPI0020C7E32B|nr:hypothetical protein [Phaeobacter piscinae]
MKGTIIAVQIVPQNNSSRNLRRAITGRRRSDCSEGSDDKDMRKPDHQTPPFSQTPPHRASPDRRSVTFPKILRGM